MKRVAHQLRLRLPERNGHGGRRPGAGRKPKGERAGVSHHGRPKVSRSSPVHVTLRVLPHVWNLRSQRSLRVIETSLEGAKTWKTFRVVHFSSLGDHLHLVVEADDQRALSSGMQGLGIRLAKGLNRMMGRKGKVFADRFHAHVLSTPAETRHAIAYVLLNHRSHRVRGGAPVGRGSMDPFSSGAWFDGWKERPEPAKGPAVTSLPRTWLLAAGWRRRGLVSLHEIPSVRA